MYYANPIQITVHNEIFIYNIEDEVDQGDWKETIPEVNIIYRMDQMKDPERLVNTGLN